jgi:hypothetical protein
MAQTMRCSTLLDLFCPVRQSPSGGGISALSRAARPPPARVPHAKTNTVLRCLSPNLTSLYGGKVWKGAASPHFHLNNPAAADAFCLAKCAGRVMGPDLAPNTPVKEHCPLTIPNVCRATFGLQGTKSTRYVRLKPCGGIGVVAGGFVGEGAVELGEGGLHIGAYKQPANAKKQRAQQMPPKKG